MEAPLSSPSLNQPPQYFQQQGQVPTSASQQQQAAAAQAPVAQPQAQRVMGDANATSPFLRDFNLVAEAAKRAQMAVLMRDMEAIGL